MLLSSGDNFPHLIKKRRSQLGFVTYLLNYPRTYIDLPTSASQTFTVNWILRFHWLCIGYEYLSKSRLIEHSLNLSENSCHTSTQPYWHFRETSWESLALCTRKQVYQNVARLYRKIQLSISKNVMLKQVLLSDRCCISVSILYRAEAKEAFEKVVNSEWSNEVWARCGVEWIEPLVEWCVAVLNRHPSLTALSLLLVGSAKESCLWDFVLTC